jgi:iron(III) transport system permease protein
LEQIYGAPGIVVAECFAAFPHALMILVTALGAADGAAVRGRRRDGHTAARKFFTITLPGAKYGLISAALVVFTLVITDFGIPKVIGGNFNVLATDVFKLVIGQQDFNRVRWWPAAAGAGGADLRRRPLGGRKQTAHAHRPCRALPRRPRPGETG